MLSILLIFSISIKVNVLDDSSQTYFENVHFVGYITVYDKMDSFVLILCLFRDVMWVIL